MASVILVVEDDPGVRHMLEAVLATEGFEVRTATDGLEGLVKQRVLRPAALILDLRMPAVSGLRVLDELYEEHSDVPVLVLTGDDAAADAARERLGPDAVLTKPVDPEEIVTALRRLIEAAGRQVDHGEA